MKHTRLFITLAAMLLLIGASGCKGRTLDNVAATGDTVEVDPGCGTPEPTDSITL